MEFIRVQEEEGTDVFITPWSLCHFTAGCAAKEIGMSLLVWEVMHALYELKDHIIDKAQTGNRNSVFNSVGDQSVATVGHLIASKKGKGLFGRWSLMFGAAWLGMVLLGDRVG